MHGFRSRTHLETGLAVLAVLAQIGFQSSSVAGEAPADQTQPMQEVVVVATTPLPGTAIDIDKIPGNVQSLRAADLMQNGAASLTEALDAHLASVNINDTQADPFQPDILFRGFEASPVLGTPQGVAIYQNGVRINEAFGDAVNWDLIPDIAIDRIDIVGTNPVYGLNALGGAAAITMKNAFSDPGGDAELSGGSFDQRQSSAEYGINDGLLGAYIAGRVLDQDGWRLFAHDLVRQLYLDFSLRTDGVAIDLSYLRAANRLYGQGAAPVQELAISRELVFTGPQDNLDTLDFVTLNVSYKATDTLSVQGVLYYRSYAQSVANGNTTDYTACTTARSAGALCQSDGVTPLTNADGAPLPDISEGGTLPIGENDFEQIQAVSRGGSLQVNETAGLFGRTNQLAAGVSVDSERVDFYSGSQIGVIDASLTVLPSELVVDTPQSSPFNATPVYLIDSNRYYGFFATDTFEPSNALAITLSARYNVAQVDLADELGTNLTGENRFTHFNPALGATYALSSSLTIYAGWSVNNRAPTASEIECSDPLRPCLLPSDLAGDPPNLKQVVAHTYEMGLRGRLGSTDGAGKLRWSVGLFRTDLTDDIYGIATSLSTGFFQNIGSTRRQGLEAALDYRSLRWSAYLSYSFVDATFRSPLTLNSSSNPFQDAAGNIRVEPGDRLPGIPLHRFKAGADFKLSSRWSLGGVLTVTSDQYYRGDESNQNAPLPGYHIISIHSTYQVSRVLDLFVSIDNLLDARYATYGLYSDPTGVGAPGIPASASSNAPGVDHRFQSPAAPLAAFAGIRVRF
jgi:iron complex outermembrane receptor protein